jgi:acyl carrier protein
MRLMTEVLGVEGIKLNDDFFQLGGDSLTAVQLVSKLEKALGIVLPRNLLMEGPTPARLAMCIDANRAAAGEQGKPDTVKGTSTALPRAVQAFRPFSSSRPSAEALLSIGSW